MLRLSQRLSLDKRGSLQIQEIMPDNLLKEEQFCVSFETPSETVNNN